MGKMACIVGMVVSACIVILFGADLAAQFPFARLSMAMDIGFVVCGILLFYMSFSTLRQLP